MYGSEQRVTVLYTAGVGERAGDFTRLLSDTTSSALQWAATTSLIRWEEAEARKERIKVFYPQPQLNRGCLDAVLGETGLLARLTALGREESLVRRGGEAAEVAGEVAGCQVQGEKLTLQHFWGPEKYNMGKVGSPSISHLSIPHLLLGGYLSHFS